MMIHLGRHRSRNSPLAVDFNQSQLIRKLSLSPERRAMSSESASIENSKEKASSYFYIFRMPTPSSIYTLPTPNETISLLHDINASRPASGRLPSELLFQINKEIHINLVYEKIRSTWSPIMHPSDLAWGWDCIELYKHYGRKELPLARTRIDPNKKRFYIADSEAISPDEYILKYGSESYESFLEGDGGHTSIALIGIHKMISSADLLYRLLCFFPEIYIDREHGGDAMWLAGLRYKQTGMGIGFMDWHGRAMMKINWGDRLNPQHPFEDILRPPYEDLDPDGKELRDKMSKIGPPFSEDALTLLNTFVGAEDDRGNRGNRFESLRRFPYFHRAADADAPTSADEHYLVIPRLRDTIALWDIELYLPWNRMQGRLPDPLPIARSLLPALKYNVRSRKVGIIEGSDKTVELTRVISSSLLFYRLTCHFPYITLPEPEFQGQTTSATGVWRVELLHLDSGARLTLMDDRGLFDIRAAAATGAGRDEEAPGEGIVGEDVMRDIVNLMSGLCREDCYDPQEPLDYENDWPF